MLKQVGTRKLRSPKYMTIDMFGQSIKLYGGPYLAKPDELKGVKMAKEINKPCSIDIPTADFSTPDPEQLKTGMIQALSLLSEDPKLYVGCMGGIGRTGLFMACMVKASMYTPSIVIPFFGGFFWSIPKNAGEVAILSVREQYSSHAVETEEQKQFIRDFDVSVIGKAAFQLLRN